MIVMCFIVFHLTIDLLGSFNVADFYFGLNEDPGEAQVYGTLALDSASEDQIASAISGGEDPSGIEGACEIIEKLSEDESFRIASTTMAVASAALALIAAVSYVSFWLEVVFIALLAVWYISFIYVLSATVNAITAGDFSPLEAALALAGLALVSIFGALGGWARSGSDLWKNWCFYFDRAMIKYPQEAAEYTRQFVKGRYGFYWMVIQISALVLMAIVVFSIMAGNFLQAYSQ